MANQGSTIPFAGQAISPNKPLSVRLLSGGIFLVPVGNFILKLGAQSSLQWYDANCGLWRGVDSGAGNHPIPVESDGTNYRVINLSGTISGVKITVAGTLYKQSDTSISFAAPAAGITATGTPIIGGSMSLSVTGGSGGTGYVDPIIIIPHPTLLGGTPGLCIEAVATAAISGGVIGAITLPFAGAGYVSLPTGTQTITPAQFAADPQRYLTSTLITIIDPAGSGAVIVPTATNGTAASGGLTGVVMTNPGSGYDGTHIPALTVTSGSTGINGAGTALPNMALTDVTIGSTNTGYSASVIGETSLGSGAAAVSAVNEETVHPRPARFTCTQSGGVLQAALIEDAGNGFQTVPLAKQVGNATADGSVNATFVAVVGGVINTLLLWQVG